MAVVASLLVLFVLLGWGGERAEGEYIPAECQPIYIEYVYAGIEMRHCTVRRFNTGAEIIYWMLYDCLNWHDANSSCAIGNGKLASFPAIEDKFYLQQFISPFTTGYSNCYQTSSYASNSAWIGLSRPSTSTTRWTWQNGDGEAQSDIPWNPYVGEVGGHNYLSSNGNCVLAAWTHSYGGQTTQAGYIGTNCAVKARSVCMKVLN